MDEEGVIGTTEGLDHETTTSTPTELENGIDILRESSTSAVTWSALVKFLADLEPVPAAGIAGIIVILVLTIFGNIGALVVGLLGGALLHASIEKKKEETSWKDRFSAELVPVEAKPREVLPPFA